MIYLDHNATTPPCAEVLELVVRHARTSFANPGSRHAVGRKARQVLETSRESLAALLGATPEEVILTSGGTESNNLAIQGFTHGKSPATIALTPGEHPSVMEVCRHLQSLGWKLHFLEIDSHGRLRPDQWDQLPWQTLRLVCVILAHNETGVLQDVSALAAQCQAHGVPLHLDAVQAVGKIAVDFHQLGAASLSLGAHKFQGPRGIGALLLRRGWKLAPLMFGGHQEAEHRPGTEPVALLAGMARALELCDADMPARIARLAQLRDHLQESLRRNCAPVVIHAADVPRLPNTLNIGFPGVDGEALLVTLDLAGICCSLGSTCASGSAEPAPILVAMQVAPDVLKSSLRLSLGAENTLDEINQAAHIITREVSRLRMVMARS